MRALACIFCCEKIVWASCASPNLKNGGKFMQRVVKKILVSSYIVLNYVIINSLVTYADIVIEEGDVVGVARQGIKLFFGSLGGLAVVMGGIEFYGAFTAHRENMEQGGYGEAESRVGKKVFAGIMCLIGAVVCFTILAWTLKLFGLD